jgi:hypothetical protein
MPLGFSALVAVMHFSARVQLPMLFDNSFRKLFVAVVYAEGFL